MSKTSQSQDAPKRSARKRAAAALSNLVFSLFKASWKMKSVIGILVVLVCLLAFIAVRSVNNHGTYLSSSELEKVVNVSRLSTADFAYNGIAEKRNESNDEIQYYISYKARVKAGIDMEEIAFICDNETRTVTPVLPAITIEDPVIDDTPIDYLPAAPEVDLQEVISLCKNDARAGVEKTGQIYQTAEDNLKSTVEALLLPLLEGKGYTLNWKLPDEEIDDAIPDNKPTQAQEETNAQAE